MYTVRDLLGTTTCPDLHLYLTRPPMASCSLQVATSTSPHHGRGSTSGHNETWMPQSSIHHPCSTTATVIKTCGSIIRTDPHPGQDPLMIAMIVLHQPIQAHRYTTWASSRSWSPSCQYYSPYGFISTTYESGSTPTKSLFSFTRSKSITSYQVWTSIFSRNKWLTSYQALDCRPDPLLRRNLCCPRGELSLQRVNVPHPLIHPLVTPL